MPMSLRLDNELEKKIKQAAKKFNVNKTEIIRRSLTKYLSEISETEPNFPYSLYRKFEKEIPGSGHGSLSINHKKEVLKKIKKTYKIK
tara:strand:+ start:232 stop:495 length:264 start_codon:yes stop_codon:yes gene_type:complete